MAKKIDLKLLSTDEIQILKDAIPLLRDKSGNYWENEEIMNHYKKWITATDGRYKEGGLEQFFLATYDMKKYSIHNYLRKDERDYLRKVINGDIIC